MKGNETKSPCNPGCVSPTNQDLLPDFFSEKFQSNFDAKLSCPENLNEFYTSILQTLDILFIALIDAYLWISSLA